MGSWYLLVLFMAVPMFLAECYVVSEILLLLKPREGGALVAFNKLSAFASAAGIALLSAYAAVYFSQVTEWRTWIDVTAAAAYVAAGIPFIYVGLLEAGLIARNKASVWKGRSAVAAVVAYLIFSHAAMVFGMFDPIQFGWQPEKAVRSRQGFALRRTSPLWERSFIFGNSMACRPQTDSPPAAIQIELYDHNQTTLQNSHCLAVIFQNTRVCTTPPAVLF